MANEFVAKNGLIAQNNSTVTGSLTVTGGITGSLLGTATTASYINPLNQNVEITGSLSQGSNTLTFGQYAHAEGDTTATGGTNGYLASFGVVAGLVEKLNYGDVTADYPAGNYLYINDGSGTITAQILSSSFNGTWTSIFLVDTSINTAAPVVVGNINLGSINWTGDQTYSGFSSHVEGYNTRALSDSSHAEGRLTQTVGFSSHAEGRNTISIGNGSHAEGESTQAIGNNSHAEGNGAQAIGAYSHAEGSTTIAAGSNSHAEGENSTTYGMFSHAEGGATIAHADYSHAEGGGAQAFAQGSHAEGNVTEARGSYSHAEGDSTLASGSYSHAEGFTTQAIGSHSHAEGNGTQALGSYSHAEGVNTIAQNDYSHAEGNYSQAIGAISHAEGESTQAIGYGSHAEGNSTIASGSYQHVSGQFNTHGDDTSLFIIGNGVDDANRSDVFRVSGSTVQVTGSLIVTGNVISTGSLNLQPNINDVRYLEIYNTSAQDTHITASGGWLFLGDDTTYIKVDNYSANNLIELKANNGVQVTGSVYVSGSLLPTNRILYDSALKDSIDWQNRQLIKSDGSTISLNWETGALTGSLLGTASWAQNASTASYLNTLNQDLTFNGNLTLNGTASITYLNVSYESSSIIYSSGSNQLGDATNDTQTLVGIVKMSGSLEVTGSTNIPSLTGSLLGTASTASFVTLAQTASYVQNAQTASYILQAVSSSYALTASFALNGGGSVYTGSLLTTASVSLNTITFTKGDGSTFPITVNTGSGGGSSPATNLFNYYNFI